jgi:hypothetical protein
MLICVALPTVPAMFVTELDVLFMDGRMALIDRFAGAV